MIEISKNFDLKGTIYSGQCFRMNQNDCFTIVVKDRVLKIIETSNKYKIYSSKEENLREFVENYFDLKRDYKKINDELIKRDPSMKSIILYNHKILRQDKLEMYITYIISQNNNVKRISYSVNKLCELFGEKIIYENNIYYLFPSKEKLLEIKIEDLKEIKVGFRDKYIMNALDAIRENNDFLEDLESLSTIDMTKKLVEIKGIGPKVASCILMFGYNRLDSYPIDTWAKKYLSERFNIKNINKLQKELYKIYGEYVGLAVQYMFNYQRNIKVNK